MTRRSVSSYIRVGGLMMCVLVYYLNRRTYIVRLGTPGENRLYSLTRARDSSAGQDDVDVFEIPNISQDDPRLLQYILAHHIKPPPEAPATKETLLSHGHPSQFRKELEEIFGQQTGGIFIEAGAADGIFLSNTLALERDQDWTGLLIEPNKFIFSGLRWLKRNAWVSNACISASPAPDKVQISHVVGKKFKGDFRGAAFIQSEFPREKFNPSLDTGVIFAGLTNCFPLYSQMAAIGLTQVDYFSLDVQGVELKILKTIPFERVKIRVISVEHNIIPEGKEAMRQFLESKGYYVYFESESDFIFILK